MSLLEPEKLSAHVPWLIELPSCASTNTYALQHHAALAHGACIFTREQTAGRGRDGRTWRSPPGVLTASFILQVRDQVLAPHVALAAGLAIAHTVEDLQRGGKSPVKIQLKWPNDCLVHGKKLAGILCERPETTGALVVGIGLNVAPQWDQVGDGPALAPHTACVAEILSENNSENAKEIPTMYELLSAIRRYLLEAVGLLAAGGWSRLLPHLRERDYLQGKTVEIHRDGLRHVGQAVGLDEQGNLRVHIASGEIMTFRGGHVVVK
jgi:BirA family transcriptional regulator, biotin operon repressor / biotin---[acetyl-CoA-carboxylase] ligase